MSEAHPLTSDQRQTLEQAAERAKAFTGAAKVAAFNGWSIGFFAAVTLLFDIFSLTALVLGVGMAVVARNEFKSRARILSPPTPQVPSFSGGTKWVSWHSSSCIACGACT